jgi:hypothetical protein
VDLCRCWGNTKCSVQSVWSDHVPVTLQISQGGTLGFCVLCSGVSHMWGQEMSCNSAPLLGVCKTCLKRYVCTLTTNWEWCVVLCVCAPCGAPGLAF